VPHTPASGQKERDRDENTAGFHPEEVISPTMKVKRDWGESGALFVAMLLFATLKNRYTLGPPWVASATGIVLVGFFALSLFWTIAGEQKHRRKTLAAFATVLLFGTVLSLSKIVYIIIYQARTVEAVRLIETAILIWVANIIFFAIVYNLIGDREFSFPRPDGQPALQLNFLDHVFLSFTTATAFSPTDMSPLTTRARMFMMLEALISLLTIAIAAARAINVLPQ
jgi:Ion channel